MNETDIENRVLGALEEAGTSLDADQVASQVMIPPSKAGSILHDLEKRGFVQVRDTSKSDATPRFSLDADALSRSIKQR